jgi:hypothetical protein
MYPESKISEFTVDVCLSQGFYSCTNSAEAVGRKGFI